jgi:hypothetical protein
MVPIRSSRVRLASPRARRLTGVAVLALATFVLLAAAAPRRARAEGGPFGLGLIIGSPTGLSLKYYLGESGQAIDGAIGWAFVSSSGIHVHADYLWHPLVLTRDPSFTLPLHVGVGVRLLDHDRGRAGDDDLHVALRAPVGITFDFTQIPLDVFIEVALLLDFHGDEGKDNDNINLDLNAGVGVRYYF